MKIKKKNNQPFILANSLFYKIEKIYHQTLGLGYIGEYWVDLTIMTDFHFFYQDRKIYRMSKTKWCWNNYYLWDENGEIIAIVDWDAKINYVKKDENKYEYLFATSEYF